MTNSLLWSIAETGRQLGGISDSTIRRMASRGDLRPVKVGSRLMIAVDSVRAWVDNSLGAGPAHMRKTCQEKTETGFTSGQTRLTGGPPTPTPAASALDALLAKPTEKTLKRCLAT
jgi:hypothetical protein